MITEVTYPKAYCFAGNPIAVDITADSPDEAILTLSIAGQSDITLSILPYTESPGVYKGRFDLSGLLDVAFKDIHIEQTAIVSQLDNFTISYTIVITGYSGDVFTGTAFWGGIDNFNYSQLKSWGWDMFTYRLQNYTRQFLFTTRTNSVHLRLRDTELFPFVFIHPEKTISFVTRQGRIITPLSYPAGTICILDMETLRSTVYNLYQELPSFFSVHVDGEAIFDITILPGVASEQTCILLFKNSLGGYERIEATGKAMRTFEMKDENTWQSLNRDSYFEEYRDRPLSREGRTVHTGYKTQDEHAFILDMVKSNEIYIMDKNEAADAPMRRCLVTVEGYEYPQRMTEPNSIQLKIRFTSDEKFVSPKIDLNLSTDLHENLTKQGFPQWNGEGFIYGNDNMLYGQ